VGCIPGFTSVKYGDIRDRVRSDGKHWIQPKMLAFLNSKLEESNPFSERKKKIGDAWKAFSWRIKTLPKKVRGKIKRLVK